MQPSSSGSRASKKGMTLPVQSLDIKGKTSPPKRYNSGSLILAMENAGQLIEDGRTPRPDQRKRNRHQCHQRRDILKKLFNNKYLALNKKTQIVTPTMLGEMIYDVVDHSIRPLLEPGTYGKLEKGLTYVADGDITQMNIKKKLDDLYQDGHWQ